MADYPALLGEIEKACRAAGEQAQEMRSGLQWETKTDGSLVTEADKAVESALRQTIARITPNAAVWGEEFGHDAGKGDGLWMLDPIDGTSNYTFGQPLWGVTAAYYREGVLQLGVIELPDLGWTLSARRSGGATLNGAPLDSINPGAIRAFDLVGQGDETAAARHGYPGKVRHIGSFVVESALFATGGLRALVTDRVCLYDAAAGIVIAREIGAEVRELDGSPFQESDWTSQERCRPFGFFPPDSQWPFQSQ